MKKSEELNLSEQTQNIVSYAKRHSTLESFYHSLNSLNVISIQDLSFEHDIELFREIFFVLSVIASIAAKPHLNNRQEEIVARSGEAALMTEEDFQKTLRDSSIWKDDHGEFKPEYVYYHKYEDDLRIYENIFIVHLVNDLSYIVDRYSALYISLLKISKEADGDLVLENSAQEEAIETVKKLSRRLNLIKDTFFYKDVSKAKNKPKIFYPTNILLKDRLYNIAYKFYKKLHIYHDKGDMDHDLYLYYFALIMKVLKKKGFEIDARNKASIYEDKNFIVPERAIFTNADLRLTISTNEKDLSFLFNYKDRQDEASSNHLLVIESDPTLTDVVVKPLPEGVISIEYLSLWHLGEPYGEKVKLLNETLINEDKLVEKFIDSHHYVVNGSEKLYSAYCPNCKNRNLEFKDGYYYCPDCGAVYKFMKVKNVKVSNKIVFAKINR